VSLPIPAESDSAIFERVGDCLSKVEVGLSDLIDHHRIDGSLNVLGLIASAQAQIRLAKRYLGVE
jgi:hypothetical protein